MWVMRVILSWRTQHPIYDKVAPVRVDTADQVRGKTLLAGEVLMPSGLRLMINTNKVG